VQPAAEVSRLWGLAAHIKPLKFALPPYLVGPLPPNVPYNILGRSTCQVANPASTLTCTSNGDGTTAPEQFIPFRPDGTSAPIQPGETMYLKSVQTGKFCRVVAVGGEQQIACDQDSAATATAITYTGAGMALDGQPFVNPGGGRPAYFGAQGSAGGTKITFLPPPVPTSAPVNINISSKGYLRADNTANYAYVGNGTGLTPPELFYMQVRARVPGRRLRARAAAPACRARPLRGPCAGLRPQLTAPVTPVASWPTGPSQPHRHAADQGGPGGGAAVAPDRPLLSPRRLHRQRDNGGPGSGTAPRLQPTQGTEESQRGGASAWHPACAQAYPSAASRQHLGICLQLRSWQRAPPQRRQAPGPAASPRRRHRHHCRRGPHLPGAVCTAPVPAAAAGARLCHCPLRMAGPRQAREPVGFALAVLPSCVGGRRRHVTKPMETPRLSSDGRDLGRVVRPAHRQHRHHLPLHSLWPGLPGHAHEGRGAVQAASVEQRQRGFRRQRHHRDPSTRWATPCPLTLAAQLKAPSTPPQQPQPQPPPTTHRSSFADPPLIPGVPNYIAGNGVCRVDSETSYVYCPSPGGNGSTVPEQFVPFRPDGGSSPIAPGQPTYLKSEETGK
jgi:hypothetical protein